MIFILLFNCFLFLIFGFLGTQFNRNLWLTVAYIGMFVLASSNVIYYLHFFDKAIFYYNYRVQFWADFTPSLSGFLVGLSIKANSAFSKVLILPFLILASTLFILGPWAKNFITPIAYDKLPNQWKNNICLQSIGTCGPCSLANILNHNGIKTTENELAKEAFTTATGTESWYLARCARRRGFQTKLIYHANHLEKDSIIGVSLGKAGHFIAILDIKDDILLIADS